MIIYFGSAKYKYLTMNDIVIPGHPLTEYRFTKNVTNIMCLPIFFNNHPHFLCILPVYTREFIFETK